MSSVSGVASMPKNACSTLPTRMICAVTLHSSYARYEWVFLGLGLAAGCLARRPAR